MTATYRVTTFSFATPDELVSDAEQAFAIHWQACRTRRTGRDCLRCDQLDAAVRVAERNAAFLPAERVAEGIA